jgi:hypothetical protein
MKILLNWFIFRVKDNDLLDSKTFINLKNSKNSFLFPSIKNVILKN